MIQGNTELISNSQSVNPNFSFAWSPGAVTAKAFRKKKKSQQGSGVSNTSSAVAIKSKVFKVSAAKKLKQKNKTKQTAKAIGSGGVVAQPGRLNDGAPTSKLLKSPAKTKVKKKQNVEPGEFRVAKKLKTKAGVIRADPVLITNVTSVAASVGSVSKVDKLKAKVGSVNTKFNKASPTSSFTKPKNFQKSNDPELDSPIHIKRKHKKDKQKAAATDTPETHVQKAKNTYSPFKERWKKVYVEASGGTSVSEKVFTSSGLTFSDLSIHKHLVSNLEKIDFKSLTTVQEKAIPVIFSGKDTLVSIMLLYTLHCVTIVLLQPVFCFLHIKVTR